jgi:hypothetical protein
MVICQLCKSIDPFLLSPFLFFPPELTSSAALRKKQDLPVQAVAFESYDETVSKLNETLGTCL